MREYKKKQYNRTITGQYTACILYAIKNLDNTASATEIHDYVEYLLDQKFDPAQTYQMLRASVKKGWLDYKIQPSPTSVRHKIRLHSLTKEGLKICEASATHYEIDVDFEGP